MFKLFRNGVVKNTLLYTITDCISKGINFLILPFLSYYLVPEQLGIASNFDVLQQIVSLLAGQAIVNALPYFYYGKSKEYVSGWLSNVLLLVFAVNLVFAALIFVFCGRIQEYLHIGLSLQLLSLVSSVFFLVQSANLTLYRLEERPRSFCYFQLSQVFVQVTLVVLLIFVLKLEAVGKILSVVGTLLIIGSIHLIILIKRRYLVFSYFNQTTMKEVLNFGVPLLPHSLSFWFKGGMDKILLTNFCGLAVNGLYSMALTFGAVFSMLNTAFSNAFIPYLQKRLSNITEQNEQEEKRALVKITYLAGGAFVIVGGLVVLFCWLIINYFLDEKYIPSFEFIPWIILSQVIYVFYGLTIQYPYAIKKTLGMGIITFTCSIVQCGLTYLFVSSIGKEGIKYSLILGAILTCIGVWWYSNKVYPMPWFSFYKK